MMDLNEIPNDHMVVKVDLEEKKEENFDGKVDNEMEISRRKDNEDVGQRCREVEEKCLALELEIQKKDVDLEGVKGRIRALEDEKVAIEEEVKCLKKRKAALEAAEVNEMMGGRDLVDVCIMEGVEEYSEVDQLIIENKVLECEKNSALKEVEVWKLKCKDLESRVVELEGRLSCQNVDHSPIKPREAMENEVDGHARDGEIQIEGMPYIGTPQNRYVLIQDFQRVQPETHVKRQLIFQNERSCDKKIAPSTPAGGKSSSGVLIDIIDSDDEQDIPERQGSSFHCNGTLGVTTGVGVDGADGISDQEDTSSCKEELPCTGTLKRKRGPKVVTSDDEREVEEPTSRKRTFKIDGSDNEGEDDDGIRSIKQVLNGGNSTNCESEDDDDNIPISQLKMNRAQGSSQPSGLHMRGDSDIQAGNLTVTDGITHPRRRLVKSKQGKKSGTAEESEDGLENLATENVEDGKSEEDGSESHIGCLTRLRSHLVNSKHGKNKGRVQERVNSPENLATENVEDDKSEEDGLDSDTGIITRSRRRLLKSKQDKNKGRAQEGKHATENMATKNVEDDNSEEDGSDSDIGCVTHSRKHLVKSKQGRKRGRAQESENGPENLAIENDEYDQEEDGSASDSGSLSNFIVNDSDVEDVEVDVSEDDGSGDSYQPEDASDDNLNFKGIISRLKSRKNPNSKWVLEGEMLSDFGKDPELCMRAVCALYRQQTTTEKLCKASIVHNCRGFSKFDAKRGTDLGNFLTDGDPNGDLVKTVEELREHDPNGVELCCTLAKHYSKQLFEMYENDEDPFFP